MTLCIPGGLRDAARQAQEPATHGKPVFQHDEPRFAATGIRGPLVLDDVLFTAAKANRIAPLQVMRADRVVGPDHLAAAVLHAHRAQQRGTAVADKPELEVLRFASGKRSIRAALDHLGAADGGDGVVVALGAKGPDAVAYFLHHLGAQEDEALLAASPAKLAAFGIPEGRRLATPEAQHMDLVLEAVAAVTLAR